MCTKSITNVNSNDSIVITNKRYNSTLYIYSGFLLLYSKCLVQNQLSATRIELIFHQKQKHIREINFSSRKDK